MATALENNQANNSSESQVEVSADKSKERSPIGLSILLWAPHLVVIFLALLWCANRSPIDRTGTHFGRMLLAIVALAIIHLLWQCKQSGWLCSWPWQGQMAHSVKKNWLPGSRLVGRAIITLMISAAIIASYNYYQFNKKTLTSVGDYADITYYYLNSKYFHELGYNNLYIAMLAADSEGPGHLSNIRRARNLQNYKEFLGRRQIKRRTPEVKSRFSPQRWEEFKHDLAHITKQRGPGGGWNYFFIDHGYNPPPTWTLMGGSLARITPVERLHIISMVDFALVVLLFVAVGLVFGIPTMLVSMLFFLVTFSGRWPILGQALLRFDWLVALLLGIVALKAKRHGIAGALLAYSALNRIFPAIFFFPYMAVVIRDYFRTKKLLPCHIRFVAGAAVASTLLLGGALVVVGPRSFVESAKTLSLHGSPQSFSSHRVGLGDVLIYRGEWSNSDLRQSGGIVGKRQTLWKLHPYLRGLGLLSLVAIFLFIWRTKEPIHRLIWLSIIPLFIMTTPQINYYNLRLMLIFLHMERFDRYRDKIGLYLLFSIEVATQYAFVSGASRYAVTVTTSIGLALYLGLMTAFLVHDYLNKSPKEKGATKEDVGDADLITAKPSAS